MSRESSTSAHQSIGLSIGHDLNGALARQHLDDLRAEAARHRLVAQYRAERRARVSDRLRSTIAAVLRTIADRLAPAAARERDTALGRVVAHPRGAFR